MFIFTVMRWYETDEATEQWELRDYVLQKKYLGSDGGEELESLIRELGTKVFDVGTVGEIKSLLDSLLVFCWRSAGEADLYKVVIVGVGVGSDDFIAVLVDIRNTGSLGRARSTTARGAVAGSGACRSGRGGWSSRLVVPEAGDGYLALGFVDRDVDGVGADGRLVKV